MKNTAKHISRLLLLAIILFSTSTCKQKLFQNVSYSGTVYDNSGNLPLANAKVELNGCGGGPGDKAIYGCQGNLFNVGTAITDASGHFSITAKAASSDIYYVDVIYNNVKCGVNEDGVSANGLKSSGCTTIKYCQ